MKLDHRSQFTLEIDSARTAPSRWRHWAETLMNWAAGQSEPRIDHRRDRQGNSYLEVYDPISDKTQTFDTPHEVRVWLEQRYSR
jgi:hypothetical protein